MVDMTTTCTAPQGALRDRLSRHVTPRTATSSTHLAELSGRLTPRDRWLIRMLYAHRVFTTHQIAQLAWPSRRAANMRLLRLYQWRVFDRFQPFVAHGTAPMHYLIDRAGAAVLAREEGIEPRRLAYDHSRALGIAHSQRLTHTIATNNYFTSLIHRARHMTTPGTLTTWWSEAQCARHFGDVVRPDAYGRWRDHHGETEWFLEVDLGTEQLGRLCAKLVGYGDLAEQTGIVTPVLFLLPNQAREDSARATLAAALTALDCMPAVPVATAHTARTASCGSSNSPHPQAPQWLPLEATHPDPRLELWELGQFWRHLPTLSPTAPLVPDASAHDQLRSPFPMPPGAALSDTGE
ncbi:replication-relaxation family protein [Streptomyces sp. NPDC059009]|uniref:replication-relaxation family protein n=1 Tax=Streptomyces sp. NPDC059009 TaxID=3346694 RepID=UPI0036C45D30